jgi:hypothetical protein
MSTQREELISDFEMYALIVERIENKILNYFEKILRMLKIT